MELDLPTLWLNLHSGVHGAHLYVFLGGLCFPFIFHHFSTAKSAIDLAILVFSGHNAQEFTKNKTVCFPSFIFWLFFGRPFFSTSTSAIGLLSFVLVRLQSISEKKERNKGAPICKLP